MYRYRDHWHPSDEDGFSAAREGRPVSSIGYSCTLATPVKPTQNWTYLWVGRKGMGNYGDLIALPRTHAARMVWLDGQARLFRSAGVPEQYIQRLIRSRLPRRHELAETIAAVLTAPAVVRAAVAEYDGNARRFCAAHGEFLGEISGPRLGALKTILKEITK